MQFFHLSRLNLMFLKRLNRSTWQAKCIAGHYQGRIQGFALGGRTFSTHLPFLPFGPFLPLLFPKKVSSPLNQLGDLGEHCNIPSGVRGRAMAENEFDAV